MAKIEKQARSALEQGEPVWEYADAPESTDIVHLRDKYGLFIGGEFVEPKSGKWFETIDPSNERPLAQIAEAGPEDVDLAVHAARDAYETTLARSARERAREVPVPDRPADPGAGP